MTIIPKLEFSAIWVGDSDNKTIFLDDLGGLVAVICLDIPIFRRGGLKHLFQMYSKISTG